jgi:hypothetical protein
MVWNWEQADWPHFTYDKKAMEPLESEFLLRSGEFLASESRSNCTQPQ